MTRSRVQFSLAAPFVQLSGNQFPTGSALTWVPAWVWRGWCFEQEAQKLAGLSDLHLHDLRHSAASFMINAGIDLYTVGKMIGHVSVASTTRYSHLANDTLMAAAEAGAAKLDVNWSKGV